MTTSTPVDRHGVADISEVTKTLASRAAQYYTEFADCRVEVEMVGVIDHSDSRLFHLRLQADRYSRDVIVKLRSQNPPVVAPPEAPWLRLCPFPPDRDLSRYEAAALSSIQNYFADSCSRFRSVHLLEYREEWNGFVMEFVPGEGLDRRLLGAHRFGGRGASANSATGCRQAGAWLRKYHEMPGTLDGPELRADRESIVQCFEEVLAFLQGAAGPCSVLSLLAERWVALANAVLPDALRTQRVHGDFWPGNVLVGSDGRIAVIDTFGYGATPGYEDIAYFLVHLRTMKPQMYTFGGWNRKKDLEAWETAFLEGYFEDEPVQIGIARLFELLALMYKWAHAEGVTRRAVGVRAQVKQLQLAWRRRFFRGLVLSRLEAVERGVAGPPARTL